MERDWILSHVMINVKDLDKAVDYYQSTGMGVKVVRAPLTPEQEKAVEEEAEKAGSVTLNYGKLSEKPAASSREFARIAAFVQVGSLQLEVIKRDIEVERIHHICFNAHDLHGETSTLMERGCGVPFTLVRGSLIIENHIDTNEVGGVILSLRPNGTRSVREQVSQASIASNWKFRGMGIAVEDIDKAVEYYQSLGLGIFQPEVIFDSSAITDLEVNGKPSNAVIKARTRVAKVGPVTYEFTQPLEGEAIYRESLDTRGEGVNDFIFTVADLDEETAKLVGKGVSVIRSGKPGNGKAFAYFAGGKDGGNIMFKLIQA